MSSLPHFQEVYFPTVIVCNINQIKKSLFASLKKSSALASVDTGEIEDLLYHQERDREREMNSFSHGVGPGTVGIVQIFPFFPQQSCYNTKWQIHHIPSLKNDKIKFPEEGGRK